MRGDTGLDKGVRLAVSSIRTESIRRIHGVRTESATEYKPKTSISTMQQIYFLTQGSKSPHMAGHTLEHPWGRQSSLKNISATRLGNGRQVLPSSVRLQYLKPHAAYSALTHGLSSKWSYLSRVTPNNSHLLNPLDVALRAKLLPALTGRSTPNKA